MMRMDNHDATASRFKVREVSADKGYLSRENFAAIEKHGAAAFIPFKVNSGENRDPLWNHWAGLPAAQREGSRRSRWAKP